MEDFVLKLLVVCICLCLWAKYVQIRPRDLIVRWPETDSHIADLNFVYCLHFMWSLHISVTVNSFLFNQYQWRYLVQQDYHIGMAELCVMQ